MLKIRQGVRLWLAAAVCLGTVTLASAQPSSLLTPAAGETEPASAPAPVWTASAAQPGIAVSLALVPGVALHGAGSLYAGRPLQAALLLLAEAGGVYLAYRGVTDISTSLGSLNPDDLDTFTGDSEGLSRGLGYAAGGLMLFLTSWFYDLTASPMAAAEPVRTDSAAAPTLTPRLTARGVEVVIDRLF